MANNLHDQHRLKKGLTIFDKKNRDEVLVNPLFIAAKKGDSQAAVQLVESLWNEDKSQELRQLILPEKSPIFFSVPSTSRLNQVPIAYARFLAQQTQDLGGTFLVGDEYIAPLHTSMMKSVKNGNRLMSPRLYEPYNEMFFERLREHAQFSQIILVEDILTTGSSVNTFRRFLQHNDIPVDCIVGIKGDTDLSPTQKEIDKLEKQARKVGVVDIGVNWQKLGRELTKNEISALSFQYLGSRYQKASDKTQLLMRRQLYYLYALRACLRYETAHKVEKLNHLIERRERIHD
ncbi:MAG: hypothetical protein IKV03_04985 [Alphaproteobacteria bacterium]|nr:hypothetical protein [Alphaproteobacteria bacterium]